MNKRIFFLFTLWFFFSSLLLLTLSGNLIKLKNDTNHQHSDQPLSNPLSSFEESPFDIENLFQDSHFDTGIPWNFTSSNNITSIWNSINKCANFNHSSDVSSLKYSQIRSAIYLYFNYTSDLLEKDENTIQIRRQDLDIIFSDNLTNGDKITLNITSGNTSNITVYDYESETPIGGYGQGNYSGIPNTEFNITLSGLSSPQNSFNILFSSGSPADKVDLDLVAAYIIPKPKIFTEQVYVNQSVSIENLYNLTYFLNFTTNVSAFEGIDDTTLSVKINNSNIWSYQITSTLPPTKFSIEIPDFIKMGGNYLISFEIELSVNTIIESEFIACIDNVYFLMKPLNNLLRNSNFDSDDYWQNYTSGGNYQSKYNFTNKLFTYSSYQTITLSNGWTALNQTFLKNNSRTDYQLALNYLILNKTGVKDLNLEIYLNDSLIRNESILETSNSWVELRFNISQSLQTDQYYEISFKFHIIADDTKDVLNWTAKLDDIYIYPLWESQLNIVQDLETELLSGEETNMNVYYNTSFTGDPIKDAKIFICNNDTKQEWGLDFSSSKKYQIKNKNNGTYILTIGTIGIDVGIYNLSIIFIRPNFPDKYSFSQINITGMTANFTIVEGAFFNETYNTWLIYENNTPYVDDDTKFIKIYIWNNISLDPLQDAFIEVKLLDNSLTWVEIYKTTVNFEDQGYYKIFLDTTNIGVINEYLNLNLTIKISIQTYKPIFFNVSTLVNSLPTELILDEIEPIFEGSRSSLSLFFKDLFHDSGIDNANVTWQILERPEFHGQLDFVFYGVYREEIDIRTLIGGNYTLQIKGEKINYDTSIITENIEIIAKKNVLITITSLPQNIIEGNSFSIQFNFSLAEINEPLRDATINFRIYYWNSSIEEVYAKYTNGFGLVNINIYAPINERKITINASYREALDINTNFLLTDISILPKNEINITLLNTEFSKILVGESNIELIAKAIYINNESAAANLELIFQIGTSVVTAFTDDEGIATTIIKLPIEGDYKINITFVGSNTISGISVSPVSIEIISPTTIFSRNLTILFISLGIVAIVAVSSLIVVKKIVLNPKFRERKAKYLELINEFDDANNMILLLIIEKKSGVDLYSKMLTQIPINPTLISGFLQAISSFGSAVMDSHKFKKNIKIEPKLKEKMKLDLISFQNYIVIIKVSKIIRTALLLKESPSERIKTLVNELTFDIEEKFEEKIVNSISNLLTEEDLGGLIEQYFKISHILPHEIDWEKSKEYILNKWEKITIDYIKSIEFQGRVYLDKIIKKVILYHKKNELEIAQAVINLRKLEILKPCEFFPESF
ncbi:MAG: hypothetical protein KAX10_08730 [Candidatus Lokiarchaeota archaeon]|nr:hypothetical protein [Candidatus Lokiarchaeota archaeon]